MPDRKLRIELNEDRILEIIRSPRPEFMLGKLVRQKIEKARAEQRLVRVRQNRFMKELNRLV